MKEKNYIDGNYYLSKEVCKITKNVQWHLSKVVMKIIVFNFFSLINNFQKF